MRASGRDAGDTALRVHLGARRPRHQRLHVHARSRATPTADLADHASTTRCTTRPSGYWTIATGCHAASTALTALRRTASPPACSKRATQCAAERAAGAAGRLRHRGASARWRSVTTQPRPAGRGAGAVARRAAQRAVAVVRLVSSVPAPRRGAPLRSRRRARAGRQRHGRCAAAVRGARPAATRRRRSRCRCRAGSGAAGIIGLARRAVPHEPIAATPHDVVIIGGGLAGLTLALQLKQRFADLDVLVLERRAHPVPEAAHKVGESSVEIGAHYFEHGARPEAAPDERAAEEVRLPLLLQRGPARHRRR